MESQGLVSRRPDATDGRRTLLQLTDAGLRMLAEDRSRREGWLAQAIERDLSDEERAMVERTVALLARLVEPGRGGPEEARGPG